MHHLYGVERPVLYHLCATACCRPGLKPVLLSHRPLLAEAVQPCLATLRAAAAWLQAPFRSFLGARAQAGWPAGVADGWAQAISDMTEVLRSLRSIAWFQFMPVHSGPATPCNSIKCMSQHIVVSVGAHEGGAAAMCCCRNGVEHAAMCWPTVLCPASLCMCQAKCQGKCAAVGQAVKAREMARLRPLFTRGLREVSGALEASQQPAVAADRPASAAGSSSAALTRRQAASDAAMQKLLVGALLLHAPAYRECVRPENSAVICMTGTTRQVWHPAGAGLQHVVLRVTSRLLV